MAKAKSSQAPASAEGSELIVIVQPDSSLRSDGLTVSSATGKKVSGINAVLKNHKASLIPIFGPGNRLSRSTVASSASFEQAGIDPASYYFVDAPGNLNTLAKALLSEGIVEAAYVKPPAEPPVIIDESIPGPALSEDAPPVTPSFVSRQLYLDPAPGGIDAEYAWTLAGGKGDGIRIIDIEGAWRFTHEDLKRNQGGVIGGVQSTDISWRNHGTAVAGEFGGDENPFGITGISPNSNVRAISIFGGLGSAAAIRKAADSLSKGDIILIELHRPGPRHNFQNRTDQLGYIAVEFWPDDYAAILYAVGKGVIVVEAAGNGAENLSDVLYNTRPVGFPTTWRNPFNPANPSSNAVLVGAGAPPPGTHGRNHGTDRSRLEFSNYGARLDVQGWGREVTSTGYGDLQGGADEDFWYTDVFSGTSSASPIVVGAIACIQGRLRNRAKTLLTPTTARNILRTTGSPQQDTAGRPATQRIGNRPNLKQIFTALGIGGVRIKIVKDVKEKERKEIIKEGKDTKEKDTKELKDVKEKEMKEFKEKEKDTKELKDKEKEIKEVLEKVKDFKEREKPVETGGGILHPETGASTEERLQNLESLVQQLSHFISGENRPDLQSSLFDTGEEEDEFQKNSNDSKNYKDSKDIETI
ncbi:S8 family serine peptidase [Pollutibacter soli]|uniref:S8 family serine peptidase n=1 Tax=Pollutibacter soli TaxID=3034157 RepID=UPI0030135075